MPRKAKNTVSSNQVRNNNNRKKKKVSAVKSANGSRSSLHASHVKSTCSITNPFCVAAKAARRPDGTSINTIPYQIRGLVAITTDASGNALTVVVPGYAYGVANGTLAATTWTLAAAWSLLPGSGFVVTNSRETRIVSMGAIFRSTASMTNCQGLIHTFVASGLAVSSTMTQNSETNLEDNIRPLTSGFESTFIAKPLGNGAHNFRSVAGITSTMSDWDWTCAGFEITGGPASTLIGYLEIVMNVEMHVNPLSGLGALAPPPRPSNPVAVAAQAAVHSSISGLITGGMESVERAVTSTAQKAVASFLDSASDFGLGLLGLV